MKGRTWTIRVASVLLVASLSACGGPDTDELLELAEKASAAGDHRTAMIHLQNANQADPENPELRLRLGHEAIAAHEYPTAELSFQIARRLGAEEPKLHVPLMSALFAQRKFQRVAEEGDPEHAANDVDRLLLILNIAQAQLALNNLDGAERRFGEALALDADSLAALIGKAQVLLMRGDTQRGDEIVADVLARDNTFPPGLLMHGLRQGQRGEIEAAEKTLQQIPKESPQRPGRTYRLAQIRIAELQLEQSKLDDAKMTIDELATAFDGPAVLFLSSRHAAQSGDLELARTQLLSLLSKSPNHLQSKRLLGAVFTQQGLLNQAELYLSEVVNETPGDTFARQMLARVRLGQRRPEEALDILAPVISSNANNTRVLMLAGRASMLVGDNETAATYFERSVASDPENAKLQLSVASTYVSAGEIERAVSILESLPQDAGGEVRDYLLVLAHVRGDALEKALEMSKTLTSRYPDTPWPYNLLGTVEMLAEEPQNARRAFDKALSMEPGNKSALTNLARLELQKKDFDGATKHLETILGNEPQNAGVMISLARVSLLDKNVEKAEDWLRQAQTAAPNEHQATALLINIFARQGRLQEAESEARILVNKHSNAAIPYTLLGEVLLALGKYNDAFDNLRTAAEFAPNAPATHANLARAAIGLNDHRAAYDALQRALELSPTSGLPVALMLQVKVDGTSRTSAQGLLAKLKETDPVSPSVLALEGRILLSDKKYADASDSFSKAYDQVPSRALATLAFRARQQGGLASATEKLDQWLELNPQDRQARLTRAMALQGREQTSDAIAEYERVIADDANNAVALNNLAWLYHEKGDPKALELADRAYAASPNSGTIADTLGWLTLESGDVNRGLELLRKAAEKSPDQPEIQFHLAVALQRNDEREPAKALLQKLLESNQSFPSRDEAQVLLNQM